MGSEIDPSRPADGAPASKADLRENLETARRELDHGGFFRARPSDPGAGLDPFPSAIERTTADKLSETVSVFDFGVRPNTGNDYTKEFEAAFAELAAPYGTPEISNTLYLPPGIYHLAECTWNGLVGIVGPRGDARSVEIRYSGNGGPGSAVLRTPGDDLDINRTTIENLTLVGYNDANRRIAEVAVKLENRVDWQFGLNNVFIWGAGRHAVELGSGLVNAHFNQFRAGNIGHFCIWANASHWYGHSRPLSVHNWTVHNEFVSNPDAANDWVEQGYIPEDPRTSPTGWFGRGLVGFPGPNVHVYIGPGRFEQEARPHPDFALIYDGNLDDPRHSRGVLMACGGFFVDGQPAYLAVSEKGRLDLASVGNVYITGLRGLMYVKDYRRSGRPRAFLARGHAPLVAISGDSAGSHGGVHVDGVDIAAHAPGDAAGPSELVGPNSLFIDRDAEGIAASVLRRATHRGTSALQQHVLWAEARSIAGREVRLATFDPRLPVPASIVIEGRYAVVEGVDEARELYLLDRELGNFGARKIFYATVDDADVRASGGSDAERPALTHRDVGVTYWDTSLERLIVWDGRSWRTPDGQTL